MEREAEPWETSSSAAESVEDDNRDVVALGSADPEFQAPPRPLSPNGGHPPHREGYRRIHLRGRDPGDSSSSVAPGHGADVYLHIQEDAEE